MYFNERACARHSIYAAVYQSLARDENVSERTVGTWTRNERRPSWNLLMILLRYSRLRIRHEANDKEESRYAKHSIHRADAM